MFIMGAYPFCYYVRGYLPGVYGGHTVVSDFMRLDAKVDGERMMRDALASDVIVFQRPSTKSAVDLAKSLKKKGKKIIFENDDSYSAIPLERLDNQKQIDIANEINGYINEFATMADGCIASTEVLGEEYRKLNPNTVVLKNTIDPLDEYTCKKNTTEKFRIGFIGSVTSNDDYIHIKDQIKALDDSNEYTIVLMGVKFADGTTMPSMQPDLEFWQTLKNVEWHPVVHVTQYMYKLSTLALDVAIIPRMEHYFNQCKSNLKFLEMSLLRIPVIAQGFSDGTSPYQGVDEPYMTVIVDNSTWLDTINTVKLNYDKYKELANKAHDYVLENYNITSYHKEWTKQIENLCKFQTKS